MTKLIIMVLLCMVTSIANAAPKKAITKVIKKPSTLHCQPLVNKYAKVANSKKDVDDVNQAKLLKKKIIACLSK